MTDADDRDAKAHRFGGDWTSAKLEVLSRHLAANDRGKDIALRIAKYLLRDMR